MGQDSIRYAYQAWDSCIRRSSTVCCQSQYYGTPSFPSIGYIVFRPIPPEPLRPPRKKEPLKWISLKTFLSVFLVIMFKAVRRAAYIAVVKRRPVGELGTQQMEKYNYILGWARGEGFRKNFSSTFFPFWCNKICYCILWLNRVEPG